MSLTQRFWITLSAVLVILALVLALIGTRLDESQPDDVAPTGTESRGGSGIGDPYLPDAGGGGYDVQHYDVQLSAAGPGEEVRGTATINAVATQDLDSLHLDLFLTATSVTVNGSAATAQQNGPDLMVVPTRADPARVAIPSGSAFTVVVAYAGLPDRVQLGGPPAYYRAPGEFVIAGEPEGATLWYPANDHPRDAATMQFTVSVPKGTEAICAGRLITQGVDPTDPSRQRWVWQVDTPTPTYATFLAVGQYRLDQGVADGRPFVNVVSAGLAPSDQDRALRWLRRSPAAVAKLERFLGPYPLSGTGGFVSAAEFYWGGLETAMRPVYNKRFVGSETLLNHELAHMWLGDTVTLQDWNDIFDNESLTTYTEWLTTTGTDPAQNFQRGYNDMAGDDRFWRPALSDPGLEQLFERVYDRGPLAVHALRTRMGDQAFFALLKSWAQQQGPRSLEQFRQMADDATPEDLAGFFSEWLDQLDRPDATADNGVVPR